MPRPTRRLVEVRTGFASSGGAAWSNEVLVAASAGRRVAVYGMVVSSDVAETVTFKTGTGSTVWEVYPGDNGGAVLPLADYPWFMTDAGDGLTVSSTTTSKVTVLVQYERIA